MPRQGRGWRAGRHKTRRMCLSCGRVATDNVIEPMYREEAGKLLGAEDERYWRTPPPAPYWEYRWPDWLPEHSGLCKGRCKRWEKAAK